MPSSQITLPDLSSRLRTAAQCALRPPDDALLQAALVKLFGDCQLKISEDILAYLMTHSLYRDFAMMA